MVQSVFWPEDDDISQCPHMECKGGEYGQNCEKENCSCGEEDWYWKDCDCEECTCVNEEEDEVDFN